MAKIKDQKKQLPEVLTGQVILDAMPQVAYVFNKEYEMLMWNKNTEKVLGYSADELYRKKVIDFVEEEALEKNEEAFANIFSKHEQQVITQNLITKSGKKIPILDAANYATIDGEEYLIGLAIDISQLRKTEEDLKKAFRELQKLKEQLREENIYLKEEYKGHYDYDTIIGESELIQNAINKIELVAPTNTTILLTGEIGTRKELFARVIHKKSLRTNQPFILADCSQASKSLIEDKLFGQESETSSKNHIGQIELAHKGTLFLYEVGELSLDIQSKLLSVLKEGRFERIGSTKSLKVDLRVIASTHHNLADLIKKGLFREDLFYRLNTYPVHVAPLRLRRIDIPMLGDYFLRFYNKKMGKSIDRISQKTIKEFNSYSWPGNVRELENVIERAVIISKGALLKVESVNDPAHQPLQLGLVSLEEHERNYIIRVLEKTMWRVDGKKGAALILNINPETLRSRMRKLKIKRP